MPEDMNCPGKEMRCNLVEENLREKSLQRSRFQRGPSLDAANHCEQTRPQANACFWERKFGGIGIGQATSEAVSWLKMDMRRGSGNSSQPPIVEVQLSSLHICHLGWHVLFPPEVSETFFQIRSFYQRVCFFMFYHRCVCLVNFFN